MKNVALFARIVYQISLQRIMTIQYTRVGCNWWIWYIYKEKFEIEDL